MLRAKATLAVSTDMATTLIAMLTIGLLQAAPAQPARMQTPGTSATTPASTPTPASAPTPAPAPTPASAPTPAPEPSGAVDPFTEPAPTPAPEPTPIGILYTPDPAPVTTTPDPVAVEQSEALKYRRLVFSNFYSLNMGIYAIPSGELSMFLGTNLRPRRSTLGTDWNTALGYQLTLSVGHADYWYSQAQPVQDRVSDDAFGPDPIFFHRHALMAQGHGGRRGRLFYAMGGGAVMWHTLLVGIEAEGKLGYIFSTRENSRIRGIVGGQMRLGGAFDRSPLPQFGAFLGFMVF